MPSIYLTLEAELEALSGIDQVTVTGSAGSFTVAFAGTHANLGVPQIFGDATHATSGTVTRTITTAYDTAGQIAMESRCHPST